MIVIDLRPYEDEPSSKPLTQLLDEHIKHVRGSTRVIITIPDEIWITEEQADLLPDEYPTDDDVIPVIIKDWE